MAQSKIRQDIANNALQTATNTSSLAKNATSLTSQNLAITSNANAIATNTTKLGNMGTTKNFKGSCLFANLPATGMLNNDYWYVSDQTTNYCYNGTSWVNIGVGLNIGLGNSYTFNNGATNPNMVSTGGYYAPAGSVLSVNNNILSDTGSGTIAQPTLYTTTTIPYAAGKQIYVKANFMVTNALCQYITVFLCDSAYNNTTQIISKYGPIANFQYTSQLSGIITLPSTFAAGNIMVNIRQTYASASAANGQVLQISQLQVIDLSTIVGLSTSLNFLNSIPFLNPSYVYSPQFLPLPTGLANQKLVFDGENWSFYPNALRFLGMSWYTIGDSITNNVKYQPLVMPLTGISSFVNGGVAGDSSVAWATGGTFSSSACASAGLISIFIGSNDYGGNTALGTIADASTVASTYGALKWIVNAVLTANPNAQVIFITPLQRGNFAGQTAIFPAPNTLGNTLNQYVQAVKDVANLFAIPVLDLFNISGINSYTIPIYTNDNLHPNDAGNSVISYKMASFINAL